eukprot:jgi/Psemu1/58637/gm1.58637_g
MAIFALKNLQYKRFHFPSRRDRSPIPTCSNNSCLTPFIYTTTRRRKDDTTKDNNNAQHPGCRQDEKQSTGRSSRQDDSKHSNLGAPQPPLACPQLARWNRPQNNPPR